MSNNKEELLNEMISKLKWFPVRIQNALIAEGINRLSDFHKYEIYDPMRIKYFLLKIPNIGILSVKVFEEVLENNGLTLNDLIPSEKQLKEIQYKKLIDKVSDLEKKLCDAEKRVNYVFSKTEEFEEHERGFMRSESVFFHIDQFRAQMDQVATRIQQDINQKLIEFHKQIAVCEYKIKQQNELMDMVKRDNKPNGSELHV